MGHQHLDVTQVNESATLTFLVGTRRAHLLVGFFVLLTGAVFFAQSARANHVNGSYTGTFVSGTTTGTVSFSVSGTSITNFVVDPDGTGTACAALAAATGTITTTSSTHTFTVTATGLAVTNGLFATSGSNSTASGTIAVTAQTATCNRDAVTFSATGPAATTSPTATATITPTPTATATLTPIPTATATPVPTNTLPKNGAPTAAIALSGLTLLELGYGLKLLARRLQVRARAVPLYLLRKLARAQRSGRNEVEIMDGVYLVRRKPRDEVDPPPSF